MRAPGLVSPHWRGGSEGGDGGAAHGDLPSRPAGDVEGRGEVRKLTVRSKLNIMAGLG